MTEAQLIALLVKRRKARKVTQEILGAALDLHQAAISRVEKGSQRLTIDQFLKACEFLQIELFYPLERVSYSFSSSPASFGSLVGEVRAGRIRGELKLTQLSPLKKKHKLVKGRGNMSNKECPHCGETTRPRPTRKRTTKKDEPGHCNFCHRSTDTKNWDCIECGRSKPIPEETEK